MNMNDSDYYALAVRLGDAAGILEEASALYGYPNPQFVAWSPDELRAESKFLAIGEITHLRDGA